MLFTNCLKFTGLLALLVLVFSCDPTKRINRDYLYFQNNRHLVVKTNLEDITIKPQDVLLIQVYSNTLNQEQAAIFNLTAGQGYTVDADGKIKMPILGELKVSGQTLEQLEKNLVLKLQPHVLKPAVNVRLQNIIVNVLGEVRSPGIKTFPKDQVTILDAIGMAGDLTDYGRRDNVTVFRENNGVRQLYEIDLRSAALFESPVYQLEQNDIVYVNANTNKLKSLKEKKDVLTSVQTGLSVVSVLTTLILLFTRN